MFDSKKIEHWLDSLQVETHFPNGVPAKVIVPPKSPLDEKMDKYDIFVQGNFSHNHGTSVFPIYGPKPDDKPFNSPMYSPLGGWGWPTYGNIGNIGSFDEEHTTPPVESPHSRLKAKLARMAAVEAVKIVDPAPSTLAVSPDYTHTITAWRGWAATNGMLESLGSNARWEPRRAPKANCFRCGDHAAPSLSCNCGYWYSKRGSCWRLPWIVTPWTLRWLARSKSGAASSSARMVGAASTLTQRSSGCWTRGWRACHGGMEFQCGG